MTDIANMPMSDRLLRLLREDAAVVVLTGAGISAESGVPTFRGKDGLWNKFDPRELACIDAFMANPQLVWEWYMFRRRLVREAQPNAGHRTLVEMQRRLRNLTLITQNVDNLHQLAGSQNVIELHGNIMRNKCFDCGAPMELAEIDPENIPLCECGGKIRPDVVWFGEMLPVDAINCAIQAAEKADLFFSIGTSAEVYPAADLPIIAKRHGGYVVEVNPESTPLTFRADEVLRGRAGEILPAMWKVVLAGTD